MKEDGLSYYLSTTVRSSGAVLNAGSSSKILSNDSGSTVALGSSQYNNKWIPLEQKAVEIIKIEKSLLFKAVALTLEKSRNAMMKKKLVQKQKLENCWKNRRVQMFFKCTRNL